ncbi:MAG: hypothetical protein GFH27_549409n34 [Chloroflexi bacterium AL-W]|nr:hypothetical protein [Chloroflexi bacterium AL-N1]NOK71369.1 hypothetical protein [Chloroflexi bacterium AL-N10]NOK78772.1 hypothetical protein [Chloroflexi bacterium AL-N5]NOK86142.1 hypothetical protein [Chloroflexi bacterium AL-W]NOK93095.1 hypothetical protein [Chloroflexi bacterium AL-N15]
MFQQEQHPTPNTESLGMVQGLPSTTTSESEIDQTTEAVSSSTTRATLGSHLRKIGFAGIGLFTFILALQLLKDGAAIYGQSIIAFLNVSNATNALGFGWLLSYVFLSGSPVAAIAVTFFASETISALQAFTMITGSRLGASFIVLFVGFIYYLRGHQRSASISIGVLALLTTAAIYIPALLPGYWLLTSGVLGVMEVGTATPVTSFIDVIYGPIMQGLESLGVPGWMLFLTGIVALLVAFGFLDRALPELNAEQNAFQRIGKLVYRPMAMFLLGGLVTSITMSVSVSLGLLVPLSAKGLIRRENTLPYIMGANITTFIDTLIAALIVGGPAAFTIVFVEMVSVLFLSLIILAFFYRPFGRAILRLQELIIQNNRTLVAFVCIMLVVPVILLFIK